MTNITSDTVLHRAPELDFSVEPNGAVTIYFECAAHRFGPNTLSLIDVFGQSKTFGKAMYELWPRLVGNEAYDDLIATVLQLLRAGILRIGDRPPAISRKPYPFGGYDSPGVQIRILRDRRRRTAFLEAVCEVVQPGDVVLDLGTGSGILAVAALEAGARHVYAVEPSNVAASARRVFRRHGLEDRITLIEGWSHHLELPEKADVLTYDLVGFEPLEMHIIEVTRDALARHLKQGARLLPRAIKFCLALAEFPEAFAEDYTFSRRQFDQWINWYGIDFSPLAEGTIGEAVSAYVDAREAARFGLLSGPGMVWTLDLGSVNTAPFPRAEIVLDVTHAGSCRGLLGFMEVTLSDSIVYSTHPASAGEAPNWLTPVWLAGEAMPVRVGDRVRVVYQYEGRGRTLVRFA